MGHGRNMTLPVLRDADDGCYTDRWLVIPLKLTTIVSVAIPGSVPKGLTAGEDLQ